MAGRGQEEEDGRKRTGARRWEEEDERKRTGGRGQVMGLNPIEASEFILGFLCNCFSCFITVRITFTSNTVVYMLV